MTTTNKYTSQPPKTGNSIKLILAERVYLAPSGTTYADPTTKYDGGDPAAPWVDLGAIANSRVTCTYNKETAYLETGIDKVRRGAYLRGKNAQFTFTLEQTDIGTLSAISGLTASSVGSIGKKLLIGQEDVVEKAVLFLGVNKLDGKEHITYNPKAAFVFQFAEQDDFKVINVTADLYAFTPDGETKDCLYQLIVLD